MRGRAPLIAVAAALFLLPLGAVAAGAFESGRALETLADASVHGLLVNSIVLGIGTAAFALLIGAPLAAALAFRRFPGARAVEILAVAPLLVPQHIHAIAWNRIIGRQGFVTQLLADRFGYVHDIRAPWFLNFYAGPAWVMACALFPLITLPLLAGLRAADPEAVLAARLTGASRLAILRRVVLPAAAPKLRAGAFMVFALSVASHPVTSLLDTPVLNQRIFFSFARSEFSRGALLAFPQLLATLAVMSLAGGADAILAGGAGRRAVAPRRGGPGAALLGWVPVLVVCAAPLAALVAKIVEQARLRPDEPSAFRIVFLNVRDEFGSSFKLAGLGAAVLMAIGWPVARRLARAPSPKIENALFATLALPPLVMGAGVLLGWKALADVPVLGLIYSNGVALVALAYAARFLPIVVRILRNGLLAEPRDAEDAARLCGHPAWRRALRVVLPAQSGAIAAAATLAFVLCFTELDATLMTYPPHWAGVQVRLFNMVHYSRDAEVSALCILSTAAGLLPAAFLALLGGRRRAVW